MRTVFGLTSLGVAMGLLLIACVQRQGTQSVLPPSSPVPSRSPSPAPSLYPSTASPALSVSPFLAAGGGLAGPVAPPAPRTACANRLRVEGDAYLFECGEGEHTLRYRYAPKIGSLHDLTVQVGNAPPFWVSFFGGPTFVFGREEIPIWQSDALAWSHSEPLLTEGGLRVTWQVRKGDQQIAYTYLFSIHGRTLRVQIDSSDRDIRAFSLDRSESTPAARILAIPYLSTFDVLFYDGLFVSAYFDWTHSDASRYEKVSQPYSAQSFHFSQIAWYEPDTAGVRQPLHEVLYMTVSDTLADVLPTIPNPPSPDRHKLAGVTLVDVWTEGPFRETEALARTLRARGVTDLLLIRHTWQRCGFDNCYPSVLPANNAWGGEEDLRALGRAARAAGYLFSLHENYTDFYPNSDLGSAADLALDSQGNPRPAWFNRTTGIQSHLLSPFRAAHFAAQISPELHRRYGTNAAFVDVLTAVPPWEKTDYNALYEGRARFLPVFQAYADVLALLREVHGGPVVGEGGAHFLYAGLVDSAAAEYQPELSNGVNVPPVVDFDLLRLHPLMIQHGVGYFPFYFARNEQLKWSGYTLDDHYHYMATEIAFCHAGYVDSPELFDSPEIWLAWVEREARLVAPIHRRCALAQPVRILYRVDSELVPVERAIAAQQSEQLFVEYDNGLQVYVNRHPTATWSVALSFTPAWADFSAWIDGVRKDFVGAPPMNSFTLPPNGWLAVMP